MMNEKNLKPRIRFKGYTEVWEQRKLGDLYAPTSERNTDLLPYKKTLSVATMAYKTDGNGAAASSLTNYKRLRIGDIAFEGHTSKEFRYGRFVLNDAGDGIMSPRFSALRPLADMPVNFWKYYIHYEPIMRKVLANSTKAGTMMNELVADEFLKNSVLVPSKAEQERIGGVFANLDRLITLYQNKIEKLNKLKQSFLQSMFPNYGEAAPKIRFRGFSGTWEQRKLSDEMTDFIVPMRDKPKEFGGNIPWTRIEDIEGKYLNGSLSGHYVTEETVQKMNLKIIPKGSLIVSSSATFGTIAIVTKNLITNQTFIGLVPKEENVTDYWYTYFQSEEARKYMKLQSAGSTIFYIARENFERMPISIPSKEEMKNIGQYFTHLDSLITLHQSKCEKLKNLKTALLERMFCQEVY